MDAAVGGVPAARSWKWKLLRLQEGEWEYFYILEKVEDDTAAQGAFAFTAHAPAFHVVGPEHSAVAGYGTSAEAATANLVVNTQVGSFRHKLLCMVVC